MESYVGMQEDLSEFFMGKYGEKSSFGTIMGPLYMLFHVWRGKFGDMDRLWKL